MTPRPKWSRNPSKSRPSRPGDPQGGRAALGTKLQLRNSEHRKETTELKNCKPSLTNFFFFFYTHTHTILHGASYKQCMASVLQETSTHYNKYLAWMVVINVLLKKIQTRKNWYLRKETITRCVTHVEQ